ncbi:phage holin family protein [Nocardia sp. NPDC057353]|uniref:phage holin family protein n=1 Tax=Nocardia sp. NPDC057353 TaxID=3346104 RepID=UPI00362DA4FD
MTHAHTDRTGPADARSVSELVGDASEQLSRLVRDEIRLATLEMQEKGKRVGKGAGLAGAGTVLALYGVGALVAAAIIGLAEPLPAWAAALVVGVVLLVVAGILALAGKKNVQAATPPLPEAAVHGVQQDVATIKERSRRQ